MGFSELNTGLAFTMMGGVGQLLGSSMCCKHRVARVVGGVARRVARPVALRQLRELKGFVLWRSALAAFSLKRLACYLFCCHVGSLWWYV